MRRPLGLPGPGTVPLRGCSCIPGCSRGTGLPACPGPLRSLGAPERSALPGLASGTSRCAATWGCSRQPRASCRCPVRGGRAKPSALSEPGVGQSRQGCGAGSLAWTPSSPPGWAGRHWGGPRPEPAAKDLPLPTSLQQQQRSRGGGGRYIRTRGSGRAERAAWSRGRGRQSCKSWRLLPSLPGGGWQLGDTHLGLRLTHVGGSLQASVGGRGNVGSLPPCCGTGPRPATLPHWHWRCPMLPTAAALLAPGSAPACGGSSGRQLPRG